MLPQGFSASGIYCGIKNDTTKLDLSLFVSDRPASAAGVYTTNLVHAAPVSLDRSRTPSQAIRAVVVNSGNANACTGDRGYQDCIRMAELAGTAVGAKGEEVLVMSTGVIGRFLPMDTIATGITTCRSKLATDNDALVRAACGILTTDTRHKIATRELTLGGRTIRITGVCKGAAMIGPKMATMLGLVMTDAALAPADAQRLLTAATEDSFNCISVDGHMSTNDTVLLLANGAAGGATLTGNDLATFGKVLAEVCTELAIMIPTDGEGATHLVTIDVEGCANRDTARLIAKTIAESALVKTAIAGADPNWGRIVSAAGYSGVPFDPAKVCLWVNGMQLYLNGAPVAFDAKEASRSIRENRDTAVRITFGEGTAALRFWTTDLTAEYVRLNADYTT